MQQARRPMVSPPGPRPTQPPPTQPAARAGRRPRQPPGQQRRQDRPRGTRGRRIGPARRHRSGPLGGRLVAVEASVGAIAGGVAVAGILGWASVACGGIGLVGAVARWHGRWLTDHVRALRRRTAMESVPRVAEPGLGAVAQLAPRLRVAPHADRNGLPTGMVWDGQGFAAALELDTTTHLGLDLSELTAYAAADDAQLAAVQLLVEQVNVPPLEVFGFAPTMTYRRMAAAQVALLRRVWVVLRHEPLWGRLAAERRGAGGADGARHALAAALVRLRVHLTARGMPATPLDAAALTEVLRGLGDANLASQLRDDRWLTSAGTHHCLAATVTSGPDWNRLLHAAAACPADRSIVSFAADLDRGVARAVRTVAAVRLVAANPTVAEQAVQSVVATGLAWTLRGEQAAGVLATLPLGGGARPLRYAIGWSPR